MSNNVLTRIPDLTRIDPGLSAKLSAKQSLKSPINPRRNFNNQEVSTYVSRPKYKLDQNSLLGSGAAQLNLTGSNSNPMDTKMKNQIPILQPIILKEIRKNQVHHQKLELQRVETQLIKEFKYYKLLLLVTMLFSLGSLIGIALVALQDPFDLILVPISFWMGFIFVLMTMLFDVYRTKNPENQRLSVKGLVFGLGGNVIVLLYFCIRVIDTYPEDSDEISNFVGFLAYILAFVFLEIIFLILILSDATKAQKLFDHRENLMELLYPKELNVYSV